MSAIYKGKSIEAKDGWFVTMGAQYPTLERATAAIDSVSK